MSPAAFDLTASPRGARLAWAPANGAGGAIRSQSFRADGSAEGAPRELVARNSIRGEIADLSLLETLQRRIALACVEKEGSDVRLVAAEGDEHDVLKTVGLGSSGAPARGQRGALSLSFDPRDANQVNLLGRVGESECVDSGRRECSGFSWWRLVGGRAESQGFSLSVPAPCTEHAVSLLGAPGKLAYSVCSDQAGAERRTTLFTVQTDPQYARADPVLPGCQPLGLFGEGSSVWLIGECEGKRRAARAGADNGPVEVRDVASPRVECVGGKARLRAGPIEVELNSPRARLELVLPTVLAPRGSRAVWSGEALLVAAAPLRKLSLARYACEGNQLKEVSVGAASAAPSAK